MTLLGDIESFSLGSLLQLCASDRKTGLLRLRNGAAAATIFFVSGEVHNAWEEGSETRIGRFLKSKGRISAAQYQEALESAAAAGHPLSEALVEKGYLTPAQLLKLRRQMVEETIYALFLWDKGEFEFKEGAPTVAVPELTRLSAMAILLEASRRLDEMAVWAERISSPRMIFKLADSAPAQRPITLSPAAWRILAMVDGHRSLQGLVSESGFSAFVVYRILHALAGAGVVTDSGARVAEGPHDAFKGGPARKKGHAHTILVVDDMKQIRNILRFSLKKEGYGVLVADNGQTALQYALGGNPPDLIVLDIMMPRIDGYEVLRQLRQSIPARQVPVIFLTSKAQKADVLKGIQLGGNDYVLKPYKFQELHQKIRRLLGEEDPPTEGTESRNTENT